MIVPVTKMFAVVCLSLTLYPIINVSPTVQSTDWPVEKTCGKVLHVLPVKGHILALSAPNNNIVGIDSVSTTTSNDSSQTTIKAVDAPNSSNFVVQGSVNDELLYLIGGSPRKVNIFKSNGQNIQFNLDESRLTWYNIFSSQTPNHYNVLAIDATNNVYILDVSINDKLTEKIAMKLPYTIDPNKPSSGNSLSISPDGNFASYGDSEKELFVISVPGQKVVADFKLSQDAVGKLIWSNSLQPIAYVYENYYQGLHKVFSISRDGSISESLSMKTLIDNSTFGNTVIWGFNQNNQVVVEFSNDQLLDSIFILDFNKHQIIDTCLQTYVQDIKWIDHDHLLIVAQSQPEDNGSSYSIILSSNTLDYYKITYSSGLLPLGWAIDQTHE